MEKEKFKVIEGGKQHGTDKCDCLFCKCKCPVCGSQNIEITYRPEWQLENDMENTIDLRRMGDFIRLECPECGTLEDGDEADFQTDKDLSKILDFFSSVLELPVAATLHYEEDGTISLNRYYPSE